MIVFPCDTILLSDMVFVECIDFLRKTLKTKQNKKRKAIYHKNYINQTCVCRKSMQCRFGSFEGIKKKINDHRIFYWEKIIRA